MAAAVRESGNESISFPYMEAIFKVARWKEKKEPDEEKSVSSRNRM